MKRIMAITAGVLLCACAGFGASLAETARIVPADTLMLVNVQDCNSLQAQWHKTSYYRLFKDPAMGAFVSSFKDTWHAKWLKESDTISTLIKDINTLPSGRLSLALVATPETLKTGEPILLAMGEWGTNLKRVKAAVEKTVKKAVEEGAARIKDEYGGVEIITVREADKKPPREIKPREEIEAAPTIKTSQEKYAQSEEAEETAKGPIAAGDDENMPDMNGAPEAAQEPATISYCYVNDTMLVCEDTDVLKFTLARIKKPGEGTLNESADYRDAMGATGPVHDVDVYVNLSRLIALVVAADTSGQSKTQLANFGVDTLGGLGISAAVGRKEGVPIQTKAVLKVNGTKKGVLKLIEPIDEAARLPKFIDSSTASVTVMNFNIKGAYDEIQRIANAIVPGLATQITKPIVPAGEDGQGGVDIRKDILDYLGNQVIVSESINRPFSAGVDPSRVVTAIAVTDAKALEKSLSIVHSKLIAPGKADMKRDFMGHTIYIGGSIPGLGVMPGMMRMATMSEPAKRDNEAHLFAFTITDTHIIMGLQGNVVEAIRIMNNKNAASVGNARWFSRAKSALPEKAGIAGFSDDRSTAEYFWWRVKEQQKGKAPKDDTYLPGSMMLQELKSIADFSLLPDFAKVKKYFGVSSYYVSSRPDGFYFESFMLDQKD